MDDPAAWAISLRKRRARRVAFHLLRIVGVVYLLVCAGLYFGQDWLVFPASAYQGSPDAVIHPEPDNEKLDLRTPAGDHVAALFGHALLPDGSPDPQAAARPTIIYFYGNGGAIKWSMVEFDHFRRLDANVLIPDFVGYGMSTGKPSEKNLYATADAAYNYLLQRSDIDPKKIIPMGWSLGGAVAIDLASRKPVAALATFNAFTNMRAMGRIMFPFVPTSLFLKYRFDNDQKIATITCPALICNGMKDTLVPPTMSDKLGKLAKGPVTRVTIKSANHNTIFIAEPKDLFSALQIFVDQIANPP
jgi:uncharacterized protein